MTSYLKLIAATAASVTFSSIVVEEEAENNDDNTASTTEDLTWPSTANDEVAFLVVSTADTSDGGAASASGFTQVASVHEGGSQDPRVTILRKVCDGTESGTLTVTIGSSSIRGTVWLGIFSGVDTTDPNPVTPTDAYGDGTTPSFAAIDPGANNQGAALIVMGQREEAAGSAPADTPSGYTELHNYTDDTVQANLRGLAVWVKDGITASDTPASLGDSYDHWQTVSVFVQAATS